MAGPIAPRLNLGEIRASLDLTRRSFDSINRILEVKRHALSREMVGYLQQGYCLVDSWLAEDIDLFAMGNSALFLELNTLVLCGSSAEVQAEYKAHILENNRHFYDDSNGGIGALIDCYHSHISDDIYHLVAAIYVQMISHPQLFIEGNHRTAVLVISFLLAKCGKPPFVLTPGNAQQLLDQSAAIENLKKNSLGMLVQFNRLKNQLAEVFKNHLDQRHLLVPPQHP